MGYGSFLAVFLPGLLIGGWSSFLLLRLWSPPASQLPVTRLGAELEQPVHQRSGGLGDENVKRSRDLGIVQRRTERRQVLQQHRRNGCNGSSLRSTPIAGGPYLLLVLIHSHPRALEMRSGIRETWLRNTTSSTSSGGRVVARFVVGVADLKLGDEALLGCENAEHGDMIMLPGVRDSMKLTSSKKLLQSYIWAMENANFQYIFKCTDTTFVLLDKLLTELEERTQPQDQDYLWGFFAGGVQASKKGRLAEESWFLCTHYLPYPEGGGYVISEGLVSILHTLREELEHYAHDDIALGVWLLPFSGIERRHDVRFNTGDYSRGCSNTYIVTHKESLHTMLKKSRRVQETGKLCEKEFSSRPSYHFNWTVPSNRCCVRQNGIP